MYLLYIIIGLVFLFTGGESVLLGSISIAKRLNISNLLVSTVIIGFGTSLPELFVSIDAALNNHPDIALGNVVGSNIANILFILAICIIILPFSINNINILRDSKITIISSFIICILSFFKILNFIAGIIFCLLLISYVAYSYYKESDNLELITTEDIFSKKLLPPFKAFITCVIGFVLLITGSHFLLKGVVSLAKIFNLSDAVIGLTLVAVGTSLPELATGIVAARHKQGDMIIGNILGSNIFNIFGILGITSLITPIPLLGRIINVDIWIMLITSILLFFIMFQLKKLHRITGIIMLIIYFAYTTTIFYS